MQLSQLNAQPLFPRPARVVHNLAHRVVYILALRWQSIFLVFDGTSSCALVLQSRCKPHKIFNVFICPERCCIQAQCCEIMDLILSAGFFYKIETRSCLPYNPTGSKIFTESISLVSFIKWNFKFHLFHFILASSCNIFNMRPVLFPCSFLEQFGCFI